MPRPRTCWPARCSNYARKEAESGPVQAPKGGRVGKPTVTLLGEMFPADPVGIGMMLEPLGLAAGPVVPTREWRELYAALDCAAVAAIHPFYTASVREFEAAGRTVVGSAPVGHDGTAAWLDAIGAGLRHRSRQGSTPPRTAILPAISGALAGTPIKGRITLSGYEGSELLVARLLIESGADVPLCRHRLPEDAMVRRRPRMARSQGRACRSTAPRSSRTSRRCASFKPDLAIGTTPVVQKAKEAAIPSLYFTNLISARPLMGPAGAGSLAQVVNAAIGNKARFDTMTRLLRRRRAGRRRRRLGGHARATARSSASRDASASRSSRPRSARRPSRLI